MNINENKSFIDEDLIETDETYSSKGQLCISKIKVNRNPKWEKIDYKMLKQLFYEIDKVEYLMCENVCPDTETAIKAIKNKRCQELQRDEWVDILENANRLDYARTHFMPTHYNDLEDDNYQRQEIRNQNG